MPSQALSQNTFSRCSSTMSQKMKCERNLHYSLKNSSKKVLCFHLYHVKYSFPPEAPTFIDTLFTVLRTKSYLPYTDSAPTHPPYPSTSSTQQLSNVGIPIPLDGLLQNNTTSPERGQKRALEYDDHNPSKGPRLGADSHFNRYANGRDYRQWGEKNERPGVVNSSNQRIQTYQPPERRGICRDYHSAYISLAYSCNYIIISF